MSWQKVLLEDVFEIARGGSPRPIENFITDDQDGLNWVMISDATASNKIINQTKKRIKKEGLKKTREVKPGDFILSNSMSFGRPYIMGIDGCIHDGWLLLRPLENKVDTDYFYHLLGSPEIYAKFVSRAAGATVKNINSDIVREVEVLLPPIGEQKRIAAILDQADELRGARHKSIDRLNNLSQAIFYKMFGDPTSEKNKKYFEPLSKHTSKIGSGATPKGGDAAYKISGIPLIRSMNVRDGYFSIRGLTYIDEQQASALNNVIVEANDVLLNITGASVARVCRAPADIMPARVNQHVSIIRPKNTILSEFLENQLLFSSMKGKLLNIAEAGATRQAITKNQIENLEVMVPSLDLQKEYFKRIDAIDKQRKVLKKQAEYFEQLFNSLQHNAFRGEL